MKMTYAVGGYAEPLTLEIDIRTAQGHQSFTAQLGDETIHGEFTLLDTTSGWLVLHNENTQVASAALPTGKILPFHLNRSPDTVTVWLPGQTFALTPQTKTARRASGRDFAGTSNHSGDILAPLPGRILCVPVNAGDEVTQGTPLVILESMKMETTIAAPFDGTVSRVSCEAGAMTEKGALLLALTAQEKNEQPHA